MTLSHAASRVDAFTDVMSRLVAGLAVVTASTPDGRPCGLLVSSICSYSTQPPSILVSVGRSARSYRALSACAEFGVHLLGAADAALARVFAGHAEDKFAGQRWCWDGAVPRLLGAPAYLRCAPSRTIPHGDHAVVIGEVLDTEVLDPEALDPEVAGGQVAGGSGPGTGDLDGRASGQPLVYYRRRLGWRLAQPTDLA